MLLLTDEQKQAVDAINDHVLVAAGAGSGKTLVLVERYIAILKQYPELSVANIVAVTFTKKAAEEMRTRLKSRLEALVTENNDCEHWLFCLAEVDRARIGTIHSLCETILKAFPAEAGVDPEFTVLDDLEAAEFLDTSIEETLRSVFIEQLVDVSNLYEYQVEDIKSWLHSCLSSRIRYKEIRKELAINKGLESWKTYVMQFLEQIRCSELWSIINSAEFKASCDYLRQNALRNPDNSLEQQRLEVLGTLEQILTHVKKDKSKTLLLGEIEVLIKKISEITVTTAGKQEGQQLRNALKQLRDLSKDFFSHYPGQLNEFDTAAFYLIQGIVLLADHALASYENRKRSSQKLDYDDLIELTYKLLAPANSSARRFYNEHLKAILIDEFQDTNSLQAKLIASLIGTDGRLLLIGDDKQSIYKFQGADVSTFNAWKKLISQNQNNDLPMLDGKGLFLGLSTSFRSHPSIISFINAFFEHIFETYEDSETYKARYQALTAFRQEEQDWQRVEVVLFDTNDLGLKNEADQARQQEGLAVANWIAQKVAAHAPVLETSTGTIRPISYGDFAILVQTNNDFASIQLALAQARIPYVTFSGSGFLEHQEIYDLENLLKWLICPEDNHALFAVLRSPMFGITDDVIHRILTESGGSLWQTIEKITRSNSHFDSVFKRSVSLLAQIRHIAGRQSLGDLVRTIIRLTNYDIILSVLPNGRQRSRNIWKLAAMAYKNCHMPLDKFVTMLDAMRRLGVKEADAPLDADNSVKLMTIHKAKGLEFPAVILPRLDKVFGNHAGRLIMNEKYGMAFNTSRGKDEEKPAFYKTASVLERNMEAAEKKRLLYVAMTRAKDYLALFVRRSGRKNLSFRFWLMSALNIDGKADHSNEGRCTITCKDYKAEYDLKIVNNQEPKANQATWFSGKTSTVVSDVVPDMHYSFALLPAMNDQHETSALRIIPWQNLLRVTPHPNNLNVHPTILGSYFHVLMQSLPGSLLRPSPEVLVNLAYSVRVMHTQFIEVLVQEGQILMDNFYRSKLYELMLKAKQCLHEPAYWLISPDGKEREQRPDLILEDASGQWHIIDFKTDHFEVHDMDKQTKIHAAQLTGYVEDFKQLTKIQAQPWIYFAQYGLLQQIGEFRTAVW